jgi:hypothetical protein
VGRTLRPRGRGTVRCGSPGTSPWHEATGPAENAGRTTHDHPVRSTPHRARRTSNHLISRANGVVNATAQLCRPPQPARTPVAWTSPCRARSVALPFRPSARPALGRERKWRAGSRCAETAPGTCKRFGALLKHRDDPMPATNAIDYGATAVLDKVTHLGPVAHIVRRVVAREPSLPTKR